MSHAFRDFSAYPFEWMATTCECLLENEKKGGRKGGKEGRREGGKEGRREGGKILFLSYTFFIHPPT